MPSIVAPIALTLDRERFLRLDNRAIFTCERELSRLWGEKVSLFTVLSEIQSLGLNDLSVMLWQALLDDDPSLTLAEVQDLMDMQRLPEMLDAVLRAWNAATQPAQAGQEAGATTSSPLAPGSTGPGSGVMAASISG